MPISQKKYIDITTYAVTDNDLNRKSLVTRIFTTNELIPNNTVIVFYSAEAVKSYFGINSDEYKFAKKYFDYIQANSGERKEISFARYTTSAVAAQLIATKQSATLAQFKEVTNILYYLKECELFDEVLVTSIDSGTGEVEITITCSEDLYENILKLFLLK